MQYQVPNYHGFIIRHSAMKALVNALLPIDVELCSTVILNCICISYL